MKKFIKNFTHWFSLKPEIDRNTPEHRFTDEGQIWWFFCGENIGTEISGKGEKCSRPGIIYKKLSRYTFLIIPTSTKIKQGSWFSFFTFKKIEMIACLHQIKIIDYKRLSKKMGTLSDKDFENISYDFNNLYGYKKNMPPQK